MTLQKTIGKYVLPLLGVALISTAPTASLAETQAEWLKRAQVGPTAPAKQDWKAIEAAARKEGKVVIYSVSSRIFKLVKKFKKKYGIDIVGHDLTSRVQLEKFQREYKAGVHQVDVLFNNETPHLLNDFLANKKVWNFVPSSVAGDLADIEVQVGWGCKSQLHHGDSAGDEDEVRRHDGRDDAEVHAGSSSSGKTRTSYYCHHI